MSKNGIFLHSEPYSPTGNVTSQGVLNQLGRPKLDIFTVLVREAVQNSWDARAQLDGSIRFGIAAWTVDSNQRSALLRFFEDSPQGLNLQDVLYSKEPLVLLSIYDRGTVGLGGPTRADQPLDGEETYDFVDFLRNVGQPPDKQLAGGTYGYGKAAFYRASRAHTILVHTRCRWRGALEGRFIGAGLGEPFESEGRRYTGRHWWGREYQGIAEPLLSPVADRAAEFLRMPQYVGDERGTTITIVQPVFEADPYQTMLAMRDALLWYFWPKMLPRQSGEPSIKFEAFWEHQPLPIPPPDQFPPLDLFVKAMQHLKMAGTANAASMFGTVTSVDSRNPKKHLGTLALEKGLAQSRQYGDESIAPIAVNERCRHVALMRQPELVVTYLSCEGLPSDSVEYAGVFVTDKQVDRIFADAEPPTHDDWVPEFLEDRNHRTFVRVGKDRIKQYASEFIRPSVNLGAAGQPAVPLGAFADMLGQLLPSRFAPDRTPPRSSRPDERREPIEIPSIPTPIRPSETPRVTINPSDNSESMEPTILSPTPSLASELPPTNGIGSTFSGVGQTSMTETDTLHNPVDGYRPPPPPLGAMRVKLYDEGEFVSLDDGTPAIGFRLEVSTFGGPAKGRIWISARAVLDDGSFEDDPPEGAEVPHVIFWQNPSGQLFDGSDHIQIDDASVGDWWVVVNLLDDAELGIDIQVEQML